MTKAKEQEVKKDFTTSAFLGWQIQEMLKGIASDKPKAGQFKDYLKTLGLLDKETEPKASDLEKKMALEKAKNIIDLDTKRKGR